MKLTQELASFHKQLRDGKIDWKFIFGHPNLEEVCLAAEIAVSFNLLKPLDLEVNPLLNSDYWIVFDSSNDVVNPCFKGKRWYFSNMKSAKEYARYLKEQDMRRSYYVSEVS